MNIVNLSKSNKGQVEIGVLIIAGLILLGLLATKQTQKEKELERFGDLVKAWEQAYAKPDFYGERLLTGSPAEESFELYTTDGKPYIIRYEDEGKAKVDSSVYSYASFDPNFPNVLMIWLCNKSRIPIELNYYNDRYYAQTYAINIYQLEIDMEWTDYGKVINPQSYKLIWIKYPLSISQIDIKNVIIRLETSNVVIGLQKIPR